MGRFTKLIEQAPELVNKTENMLPNIAPELTEKIGSKLQQQAGKQVLNMAGYQPISLDPLPAIGEGIKNIWNTVQGPREEALKTLASKLDFQQGTTGVPNEEFQKHALLALDLATPDITNAIGGAGSLLKMSNKAATKVLPKTLEAMSAAKKVELMAEKNPQLLEELAKGTAEKLQSTTPSRFGRLIHQTSTPIEREVAKKELTKIAEQGDIPKEIPKLNTLLDEYSTNALHEATRPVTPKRILETYHANPVVTHEVESLIGREAADALKKQELQRIKMTLEEQRQTAINTLRDLQSFKGK